MDTPGPNTPVRAVLIRPVNRGPPNRSIATSTSTRRVPPTKKDATYTHAGIATSLVIAGGPAGVSEKVKPPGDGVAVIVKDWSMVVVTVKVPAIPVPSAVATI